MMMMMMMMIKMRRWRARIRRGGIDCGGWVVVVMVVIQDGLYQRLGTCPYGQLASHLEHTT